MKWASKLRPGGRFALILFGACAGSLPFRASAAAVSNSVPLKAEIAADRAPQVAPLTCPVNLPAAMEVRLHADQPALWLQAEALTYEIAWPADAPSNAQTLVYLIDRDDRWHQSVQDARLVPGATQSFRVPLAPGDPAWQPSGHTAAWHFRSRLNPRAVGLRVFGQGNSYSGACVLASAALVLPACPPPPPVITHVRVPQGEVACYDLMEIRFDLPDRYANPFDPEEIDVQALFTSTNGAEIRVGGFYYQDHYRVKDDAGEQVLPQGKPEWRARFTPTAPGTYRFALRARDRAGEALFEGGSFAARPAAGPGLGFVRVSRSDPRYFETDDRRFYYPIGHNVRSPFDTRMDRQFPWRFRQPEGSSAYARYFSNMQAGGENLAEVWSCAWSLGLEWSPAIPGYPGAGDYRMDSAWELDQVFQWARRHGLRINFVLNNHGRISSWCDPEWKDHPYNVTQGGWLNKTGEFFSDERAIAMQYRLCRYLVDRYGWDRSIFAWVLMSELDLVGDGGQRNMHHDPRVHDWHRKIARYIRERDPWKHLVATHISSDYTIQDDTLARMPELDHNAVDAYHNNRPGHIVDLLQATARHNAAFGRPVLVTEFGGSPFAAGMNDLKVELHAALWASTASTLAGTPLFWWWHVIEEEGLYSEYRAIATFMEGVDKRDPELKPATTNTTVMAGESNEPLELVCVSSPNQAIGWVWTRAAFQDPSRTASPVNDPRNRCEHATVDLSGFGQGVFRIEICDTATGQAVKRLDLRSQNGRLRFAIPPFSRDTAFKIMRIR